MAGELIAKGLSSLATRLDEQDRSLKRAKATAKFLEANSDLLGVDPQQLAELGADEFNAAAEMLLQTAPLRQKQREIDRQIVSDGIQAERDEKLFQLNKQKKELDIEESQLKINSLKEEAQNPTSDIKPMDLRKEFNGLGEIKDFRKVDAAYNKVKNATDAKPSPAGDLAIIFNYMKILDPGSVVREGEFATAQNAASVPDQIRNLYNRVVNGERLNANQLQLFV